MDRKDLPKWRQAKRLLKKHLPLPLPATVRLVKFSAKRSAECMGQVFYLENESRFLIEIDRNLQIAEIVDTLAEEWAHCLDQFQRHDTDKEQHGETFKGFFKLTRQILKRLEK